MVGIVPLVKVSIYWPDYTTTVAVSASRALEVVAQKQWEEEVSIPRMKELLAGRAWAWTNQIVDHRLPDDEFLKALGDTGMVFVWFGDGDPWVGLNARNMA